MTKQTYEKLHEESYLCERKFAKSISSRVTLIRIVLIPEEEIILGDGQYWNSC